MSLPIPQIIENAVKFIKDAKNYLSDATTPNQVSLSESSKLIHEDDLTAVLNEVGIVYAGLYNMKVLRIAVGADKKTGNLDFVIQVDFGLGPRTIASPLTQEVADSLVKNIQNELATLKPNGIIMNVV